MKKLNMKTIVDALKFASTWTYDRTLGKLWFYLNTPQPYHTTRTLILILGLLGFALLVWDAGWLSAIGVFILLWANNIEQTL
jgi:hypothetical protein